ncbi:MAG: ribosomal protein L4/L1e [Dehalococcoidia bacterium]|nr:ribosomal protein L4/L1e [Dehalococcoidia bacterium]
MNLPLYNTEGKIIDTIQVRDDIFGITPHKAVLHQAVVRQLANARQGNASTKTRGMVAGSTIKLFRQKGTGRARQGGVRAPHRRGGGIVFGPHPRSYRQAMPKKMRRLAIRSALSSKVAEENLIVLQDLEMESPSTKEMLRILGALGIKSTALIITGKSHQNIVLSARNIAGIRTLPALVINTVEIINPRKLIMTLEAVRVVENMWGVGEIAAPLEDS